MPRAKPKQPKQRKAGTELDRRRRLGGPPKPKSTRPRGRQKGEALVVPKQYATEAIIAALRKKKGMVYLAAKLIGCSPDTIYKRAAEFPEIKEIIKAERGKIIDDAEEKLANAIKKGEAWAITLALKTIGKHRGYVERVEQTGADGAPLERGANVVIVEVPSAQPPIQLIEGATIDAVDSAT